MTGWRRCILYAVLLTLVVAPAVGAETSCVVRDGDTLWGIAHRLDVPLAVLQACNGITDPSKIKPGMTIRVPDAHVVQKGETLFGIAHAAEVSLDKLRAVNGLKSDAVIKAGDRLYLPPGAKVTAVKPAAPSASGAAQKTTPSAPATLTAASAGRWPLPGKRERWTPLRGIIGVSIEGARGDGVVSVTDGQVSWAGPFTGFGKMLIVTTADGHRLTYAGNEKLLVKVGDHVRPGMEIAELGITGSRARLYFSVQTRAYEYVDPEKYLTNG